MWIAHDFRAARRSAPTALAIGNFDGVHRGHRHLLDRVGAAARAFGGESVALTFDPHPTRVLAPDRASPLVFMCHHGIRSLQAAERFVQKGFRSVYNLNGGIDGWSASVDPSVPRY